jgi:hypothetical protein
MLNSIITPPRVPLVDPDTGLISRAWYLFFLSLNNVANAVVDDPDVGPSADSLIASYDAVLQTLTQELQTQSTQESALDQIAELQKQVDGLSLTPRTELGTIASQNENNVRITGGVISGLSSPLPVASGGTGVTTSTGSGSNVLSDSPTFTGTVYNSTETGFTLGDGSTWTPSGFNAIPNYGMGYLTTGAHTAYASFGDMYFYVAQGLRFTINQSGQFIAPDVYSTTVGATNRDLYIDNTGLIGYVSSTRESKTLIEDITDTDWLMKLKPKTFHRRKKDKDNNYTDEFYDELEYGLVADDAENTNPELCFYDETEDGKVLRGVHYSKLIVPLLHQVQRQNDLIKSLTSEIARLVG